jgi:hypothetical protein
MWRTFRVRTWEALVFVLGGILVTLANSPVLRYTFPILATSQFWALQVINAGWQRALKIGAAIGMTLTTLRVLFGKETAYMGLAEEGGQ